MNNKFNELGLGKNILKSIEEIGYIEPSKIQNEIIPLILNGNDVIGQAATGTGKTLAFAASILTMLDRKKTGVKVIVLVPTRELAIQVSDEFEVLNKYAGFKILSVYGGSSIENQISSLKKGMDIIVGTPGRVIDLIDRKKLNIENLDYFVLDEADEMLNMGFLEDIELIFKKTNEEKQVLLFSATMPKMIKKLAETYMKSDYKYVEIVENTKTSVNVEQHYYLVNEKLRVEAMCRILDSKESKLSIIFCKTKRDCDMLLSEMQLRNYSVEAMHGDIAQNMRIQTLERFKRGSFNYLIATDVAARGIHVDNIECVINYNIPQDVLSYIHRIGRTGRASNKGEAITLVTPREQKFIEEVEKYADCNIVKKELPNTKEIFDSKIAKTMTKLKEEIANNKFNDFIEHVRDMNKNDLINFSAALLKIYIEEQIGSDFNKEIVIKEERKRTRSTNTTRVFLTIGKIDDLKKGTLLDFLKKTTKVDKDNFKNIDIVNKFTFIDVDNKYVDKVMKSVHNTKLNNRTIRIEKANKQS